MTPQENGGNVWAALLEKMRRMQDYPVMANLCRKASRLEQQTDLPLGLTPLRMAVIGGATTDLLIDPLRWSLMARGIEPEIHVGGFNQFIPEMLDPNSALSKFAPRVCVVVNTPFNVADWPALNDDSTEVARRVEAACRSLMDPCRQLHERVGCDIILNTLHTLPARPAGNLGAKLPGDPASFIRRVNIALGEQAPEFVHLNDVAALAERHGIDRWFDARYWYHAKQPCSFDATPDYVHNTAAIVAAIMGKSRRCLVVDLDNTLWGGVVGDDGVEGIELGEGTAEGEAFKAFQTYLRELKDRGIVLAVCSKNDESIARSAFEKHPEMVLKVEDFVAFVANWGPKSDNLEAIARQINLGLDALVFVDDNPAEREQVRQQLPMVAVPEVGDEPADFIRIIEAGHYFEATAMTAEDLERTTTYKRRQAAADQMADATDLTAFLASLDMKAVIRPFEDISIERITQLTNKTNQFNLTTRRVTLSEIKTMASDPAYLTRSVRLSDRFGDHGLISVVFGFIAGQTLTIEAWLMSCRVLNRNVEQVMLNDIVAAARNAGIHEIIGVYKPTERNGLVRKHYAKLGFAQVSETEEQTVWQLNVDEATPFDTAIDVDSTTATGAGS